MAKITVAISIDEELKDRIRAEAERLNQPFSWYVRRILEQAVWPDKRAGETDVHPTINGAIDPVQDRV